MKINKSPTVSSGVRASACEIWTTNLAQLLNVGTLTNSWSLIFVHSNCKFCKVGYPVGTPKPDIQMRIFLTWDFFFNAFIFSWKKSKPVGYTRTLYSQTGKNTKCAETFVWCLLLIFKVVYRDHLTQLLTSLRMGFHSERAAGLRPSGLKSKNSLTNSAGVVQRIPWQDVPSALVAVTTPRRRTVTRTRKASRTAPSFSLSPTRLSGMLV